MSERIAPNSPIVGWEAYARMHPRISELLEFWCDQYAFWDAAGGLDGATEDELETTQRAALIKSAKIVGELGWDSTKVLALSNFAQATAQDIRRLSLSLEPGDFDE